MSASTPRRTLWVAFGAEGRGFARSWRPAPSSAPAKPVSRPQRQTIGHLLAEARQGLSRVAPRGVAAAVADGAVLVDIRADAQRAADGHIPEAFYVPRNALEWRADPQSGHTEPALGDFQTRLILICHEGYQSSLAAAMLQRLGRDVTDVVGGFLAWRAAGLPVSSVPLQLPSKRTDPCGHRREGPGRAAAPRPIGDGHQDPPAIVTRRNKSPEAITGGS